MLRKLWFSASQYELLEKDVVMKGAGYGPCAMYLNDDGKTVRVTEVTPMDGKPNWKDAVEVGTIQSWSQYRGQGR